MAHVKEIDSILEELIRAHDITHSPEDVDKRTRSAWETFNSSDHARTNQFEVNARLERLAEKSRILNRDDLADALENRVTELSHVSNEWTPEALSLLLQLSHRMTHESHVESLTQVEPKASTPPSTWADADDEGSLAEDTGLWRNIDFADGSSGEGSDVENKQSEESEDELDSMSPISEDLNLKLQRLIVPPDRTKSSLLPVNQYWKTKTGVYWNGIAVAANGAQDGLTLTELQAMRKVIFMLLGLPTTIYTPVSDGSLKLSQQVLIRGVSSHTTAGILDKFAVIGGQLERVRILASKRENVPLLQTFQATLRQRLRLAECVFHDIQAKVLDDSQDFVPSLLSLHEDASHATRFIRQLDPVLQDLELSSGSRRPFHLLDCLFDRVCFCHSTIGVEAYEYMAGIFFECFRTYLKPIGVWMQSGQLDKQDQVMFIRRNAFHVPPGSLWQDQFSLVCNDEGDLRAPKCLHFATKKIFNTGKSIAFLERLGFDGAASTVDHGDDMLSFDTVCRSVDPSMLSPFPELFNAAFDQWIFSRYRFPISSLHTQLEQQCGLSKHLNALEYIYFSKNSAVTNTVLTRVFDRIDNPRRTWDDPFVLSQLFQSAFATVPGVDSMKIGIESAKASRQRKPASPPSMNILEDLCINYPLPWPITNIIRPSSLSLYQRVFIFLAQTHRAKYLLQRHKMRKLDHLSSSKSWLHQIYSVRTRLLFFVNTALTHLTAMVLDPCTASMRDEMAKAEDVDAMISVHATYMDMIEDQCFLSRRHASLKQAMVALLDLTVLFADLLTEAGGVHAMGPSPLRPRSSRTSMSSSSEDEGEDEAGSPSASPAIREEPADATGTGSHEKLGKIQDNLTQLFSFVTASVQGLRKSDSAPCWEVLAGNLAAGLGGWR
ncbi:MAG: hypothetical protein Q9163_002791 [Psora crenata]